MKDDRGDGLAEVRGGFLGLLSGFSHIGCEPWCSRDPRRALVAAIIRWAATRTGTIGTPTWMGIGLHALHALSASTTLGCCEGYRPRGRSGPHVYGGLSLTVLQT